MALPNSVNSSTPAGSDSPSQGDDQIRALKLFLVDVLGLPDNTSITQAAFDIDAGGLAQAIFYDAAVTPASGELGRSGSTLYYRITGSHTNSVLDALGIIADTSGSPAASIGTGLLFQSESADEAPSDILRLAGVFSDVSAGSEDSVFSVYLRVGGRALDEKYRLESTAGDGFTAIVTHAVTADRTFTLPDATTTLVGTDTTQTLTGKTLVPAAVAGTPAQHALYQENVLKGWARVTFSGGTPSLSDSFNVSGVADGSGTGRFVISWDRDFANATYAVAGSAPIGRFVAAETFAVGSVEFGVMQHDGTAQDETTVVMAVGDQ